MSDVGPTDLRFSAALLKLEFDKVVDRVVRLAQSDPGRDVARQLHPLTDLSMIQKALDEVSEAKELSIAEGTLPLDGIKNIFPALKNTLIQNHVLTAGELLNISSTLNAARTLHGFLSKRKKSYPKLSLHLDELFYDKVVEFNIQEAIDESGKVRDNASKDLKAIRKSVIEAADMLRNQLSIILRKVSEQELVQEEIITTRDGRLVIPIKVEHKKHVPGFIHSSSASGATVYIEPTECLELNNTLRELHLKEQREIEKILGDLTGQVREIREQLEVSVRTLASIDVIAAKAKYSIEILGNAPRISGRRRLRIVQARHPVLLQRESRERVIPLDLTLGEDVSTLVITGPNAGGKSVAMKTVGLLSICMQAGLHIPANSESELPVFQSVFVDIGDDQSIENDLSTFSSHLVRLREIVLHADRSSLVLIDEIGAGTDPSEGAALGAAILQSLTERGSISIATTHHGILKALAHDSPQMANSSLEFDQETLTPTYRFRFGVPGSSYALELAQRLKLPSDIVENAHKQIGSEKNKLESLLADLERQSQDFRQQVIDTERERDRLQKLVEEYQNKVSVAKKEATDIRLKAAEEAQTLLNKARGTIEQTVKEIRESSADRNNMQAARKSFRAVQSGVDQLQEQLRTEDPKTNVEIGDFVRLKDGTERGEVVELRGKEAIVMWKNGTLRVPFPKLVKEEQQSPLMAFNIPGTAYTPDSKTEVDLRGMLGDEAIQTVQRFLDDAIVAGLHRVDIIHGKGTGALRKRVTEFLKEYPHIRSFRLGEWNEGGSGVTVVELE
jgi:DNA mismatch repair protein MutS2